MSRARLKIPRIIAISPEFHGQPNNAKITLRNAVAKAMSPAQGHVQSRSGMSAALAITWCEERGEAYTVTAKPGVGYYVRRGAVPVYTVLPDDTADPITPEDVKEPYDRDGFGSGSDGS